MLYATDELRRMEHGDITQLAATALHSKTGRVRICLHPSPEAELHEMLIALRRGDKYPPHLHLRSETSYYMCRGEMTLYLLNDEGKVTDTLPLAANPAGGSLVYARVPERVYRCIRVESEVCVFMETRLGPFVPGHNVIAPFQLPE